MHILDETQYLLNNSEKLEFDDFIKNETFKRSFVRSLEIIGEAAKNIPRDFRNKYTDVPWKDMTGARDVLVHKYFGADYKTVWDIVKNKIPNLKLQIEKLLCEVNDISGL